MRISTGNSGDHLIELKHVFGMFHNHFVIVLKFLKVEKIVIG